MSERFLTVEFKSYWHTGSGQSSGTYLDALTEKDSASLPFIAGKQLKGVLRHAVRRAQAWSWLDSDLPAGPADSLETLIFGSTTQLQTRSATLPGMLQINDACLPRQEAEYLALHPELSAELYQPLYSTAIDSNGSAKAQSLRGIEVCLPVTLLSRLQLAVTAVDATHRAQQQAWLNNNAHWHWLEPVLPLIDALGASRSRGLGEAVLHARTTLPEGAR